MIPSSTSKIQGDRSTFETLTPGNRLFGNRVMTTGKSGQRRTFIPATDSNLGGTNFQTQLNDAGKLIMKTSHHSTKGSNFENLTIKF